MDTITAQQLKNAFLVGASRLEEQKDIINELNVFPVPDGDTGTNMSMTVASAVGEILGNESEDPKVICKAISQGALRGARGNSGVILSQLFRGFYKVIKTEDVIDIKVFAKALDRATETAYKAVMRPKEGTILSIAKAISERALEICDEVEDFPKMYEELVKRAEKALDKTPDQLPVLKQAGVVDSGGAGLLEILKGASDYVSGKVTDVSALIGDGHAKAGHKDEANEVAYSYELKLDMYSDKEISGQIKSDIKVYLESIGIISSFKEKGEALGIKISTNEPGRAITRILKSGYITNVELNNISAHHVNVISENKYKREKEEALKEIGFVTVSSGDGLKEIFEGLGVDVVISGGQTMNPSTEDILRACDEVNSKSVIILPNNKNILLAANQAASLSKDKELVVVPTTTIPQGISALVNYVPDKSAKENAQNMEEEMSYVKSGEVTYAIRNTQIEDKEIKKGDYMGIGDLGIAAVDKNITTCTIELAKSLCDEDTSLISVYYGKDIKEKEATKLVSKMQKAIPDVEIELQYGGQPVYYYFLSAE